jgi:hypothetical protein
MASSSQIIDDLVTWYKDRPDWETELDAKIEHFVNLIDGEELKSSFVNGQRFEWIDDARQPSDWVGIYQSVKKKIEEIENPPDYPDQGTSNLVSFSKLRV